MRDKASVNREKFLRAPIIKRKKSFKAPTVTAKDSTPLHECDKNFAEEGLCDLFGSDSFKAQLLRDEFTEDEPEHYDLAYGYETPPSKRNPEEYEVPDDFTWYKHHKHPLGHFVFSPTKKMKWRQPTQFDNELYVSKAYSRA